LSGATAAHERRHDLEIEVRCERDNGRTGRLWPYLVMARRAGSAHLKTRSQMVSISCLSENRALRGSASNPQLIAGASDQRDGRPCRDRYFPSLAWNYGRVPIGGRAAARVKDPAELGFPLICQFCVTDRWLDPPRPTGRASADRLIEQRIPYASPTHGALNPHRGG
jgi:hypothetical protein